MYQNFYYIFFVVSIIWLFYKKENFIVWLPLFYVILESGFSFFSTLSIVTYLRPIVFIILFIFFYTRFKIVGITKNIFIFLLYTFFLVILSGEFLYSFKGFTQVFISMMCLPLGYIYFNSEEKIKNLNISLFYVILFSLFSSIIGYVFGIGKIFDYDVKADESVGLLGSYGLYSAGVIIGILPFLLKTIVNRFGRLVLYASSLAVYVFILLNVRRTAILIPLIGLLTYLWFTSQKSKVIKWLVLGAGLLIITSPLYLDVFLNRYLIRESRGRFDENFYKTEMRYVENVQLLETLGDFNDPFKIIFGVGNNIFAENIENSEKVARMYHTDIAKLFYGVGLMGFILYIYIYYKLYNRIKRIPRGKLYNDFRTAAWSIFFISIFVSINGSITLVTFRSITFLLLGAFIGYTDSIKNKEVINNINP